MKTWMAALTLLVVCTSPAMAQSQVALAPYSDWVLSYDDDSCVLKRQFGEPGEQAYLELRQFGPRGDLQVVVASSDFNRRDGNYRVAFEPYESQASEYRMFDFNLSAGYEGKLFSYKLAPDRDYFREPWGAFLAASNLFTDQERELLVREIDLEDHSRAYARLVADEDFQLTMRRAVWAFENSENYRSLRRGFEAAYTGIRIERAFEKTLVLETGSLHAPMEAMRTCIDELLTHWGIDAAAHASLTREVEPVDRASWARELQRNYPISMLMRGMQGYLRTRLSISAEGEVSGCVLQTQINDDQFERAACGNLMRARFNPALDAQGHPIPSYHLISIIYFTG